MTGVVATAGWVAMGLIAVAVILVVACLVRGPSLPDRVIALDLLSLLVIGVLAVEIVVRGEIALLGAVLALALIAFLGTVSFARYLEEKGHDE
jgi:multicomponent Na+:H+ antiporter subunit F